MMFAGMTEAMKLTAKVHYWKKRSGAQLRLLLDVQFALTRGGRDGTSVTLAAAPVGGDDAGGQNNDAPAALAQANDRCGNE